MMGTQFFFIADMNVFEVVLVGESPRVAAPAFRAQSGRYHDDWTLSDAFESLQASTTKTDKTHLRTVFFKGRNVKNELT